uniref:Potassium channel domain-containing protein n=1 Tax=Trichuris muris TaxID=70415 RepID=A0A5S6QLS7_TRIMR
MPVDFTLPTRLSGKLSSWWNKLLGKNGDADGPTSGRFRRHSQTWWQVIKALNDRFWLKDLFLTVILVVYAFLGGLFFLMIECPTHGARVKLQKEQRERDQNVLVERIIKMHNDCTLLPAVDCKRLLSNAVVEYEQRIGANLDISDSCQFLASVFYASTILTTIGYGHRTCQTTWGRATTIIYAIIGIPLMLTLVNGLGKRLFVWARRSWNKLRRFAYSIHSKYVSTIDHDAQWPPVCRTVSVCSITSDAVIYQTIDDVDFPVALSLGVVIVYILVCSAIFMMWERRWDYFTSLYFFFISLSTIGFGDVVPESITFTLIGFPFYVIGLSLVSACINVIQAKVERSCELTVEQIYRGLETLMSKVGNEVTINSIKAVSPIQRRLSIVQERPEDEYGGHAKEDASTMDETPMGEQRATDGSTLDVIQIYRSPGERKITLRRMNSKDADQLASFAHGLKKTRSQASCISNCSDWPVLRRGGCADNVSLAGQCIRAEADVTPIPLQRGTISLKRTPAFKVTEFPASCDHRHSDPKSSQS